MSEGVNLYVKSSDAASSTVPIVLFADVREKERVEHMAEIYSIMVATDHLERMYVRDLVSAEEYYTLCSKLITQFKTAINFFGKGFSLAAFLTQYDVQLDAAKRRLIESGVPATIEHAVASARGANASDAVYIAKAVESFITTIDCLTINIATVEKLHPCVSNLMEALNSLTILPSNFEAKPKVCQWLLYLNSKASPTEELTADEIRQFTFDLEKGLQAFMNLLNKK